VQVSFYELAKGRDVPLSMFGVGDRIADDVFEEYLEYPAGFAVDE
jgi:hypothetical protein